MGSSSATFGARRSHVSPTRSDSADEAALQVAVRNAHAAVLAGLLEDLQVAAPAGGCGSGNASDLLARARAAALRVRLGALEAAARRVAGAPGQGPPVKALVPSNAVVGDTATANAAAAPGESQAQTPAQPESSMATLPAEPVEPTQAWRAPGESGPSSFGKVRSASERHFSPSPTAKMTGGHRRVLDVKALVVQRLGKKLEGDTRRAKQRAAEKDANAPGEVRAFSVL